MGYVDIILIIVCALLFAVLIGVLRSQRSGNKLYQRLTQLGEVTGQLSHSQAELSGKFQQNQSSMNERLEALSKRLGEGFTQQTEKTGKTLKELHERLAVIDSAQKNITDLSKQMVGLQDILSNKQARGAFGEIQLNDLVSSILPPSAYSFQEQLGNGTRADCLLSLPNLTLLDPLSSTQNFRLKAITPSETLKMRSKNRNLSGHSEAQ